jgi:GT2 family glycosyltransferase
MVLFRRECLEAVNGYDEELAAFEDWEIQIRLALAGYESDVLPRVGQRYRRHATSMSFSTSNAMRGELVQYILRKHAPQLTQQQLVRLLQNVVGFWKDGYEPSRSVLLQRERPVLPPDRSATRQPE